MFKYSSLIKCLAAAGLTVGLAAHAVAAPTFMVDPTSINGAGATFSAEAASVGASSELITFDAPIGSAVGGASGTGYAQITGFVAPGGGAVGAGVHQLTVSQDLYLTFTIGVALDSGLLGLPNSTYTVNQLDFMLYASPTFDTVYTQAAVAPGANTPASVVDANGDDILLGFGSLINGSASINDNNGVGINTTNYFGLCNGVGTADLQGTALPAGAPSVFMAGATAACLGATGVNYFIDPVPFFALVFTTFSNTQQGIVLDTDSLDAAVIAAGRADFLGVPEPATLALVGLGLLGAGIARKRKSA